MLWNHLFGTESGPSTDGCYCFDEKNVRIGVPFLHGAISGTSPGQNGSSTSAISLAKGVVSYSFFPRPQLLGDKALYLLGVIWAVKMYFI